MWKKQGVLMGRRSSKAKAGRRGRWTAETLRENSSDTVQVYKQTASEPFANDEGTHTHSSCS